jgi:hypothetical protein
MRDELDPVLLRHFALGQQDLPAEEFMTRLEDILRQHRSGLGSAVAGGTFAGVAVAISSFARLRHLGLLAFTGAALTLWALLA